MATAAPEPGLDSIREMFLGFAKWSASPLYRTICSETADDPEVTGILLAARPEQRMPMLLLAAVNMQRRRLDIPFPPTTKAFVAFCAEHRAELEAIVGTRRTQTNEVNRCSYIRPAIASACDGRPLSLIEVGTSRGLLLNMDRYHYDYGDLEGGDPDSPVRVRTKLRFGTPPLDLPEVVSRVGLDLAPAPDDEWLLACAFADQPERAARLEGALEIAAAHPPRLVQGDALDLLPDAIAETPADTQVVVFHTAVLGYMPPENRERLLELTRDVTYAIAEDAGPGNGFAIEVNGEPRGTAHVHGSWLEWGAPVSP